MERQITQNGNDIQINQFSGDMGLSVLKSIRDPLGVFGIDFSVKWVNKSMAFIHQCTPEDMIGKNCYFDYCKNSTTCCQCPIIRVRDTGKSFITERSMKFPDGITRWGEIRANPVWSSEREILAVTVLIIETTEIRKKLQEKKEYNDYLSDVVNKSSVINKKNNIYRENIKFTVNMSKRETEVLRLLTEGYTNVRISGMLSISSNTVKRHVDNIFNKLGVNDRTQAAVLAVRNKLI